VKTEYENKILKGREEKTRLIHETKDLEKLMVDNEAEFLVEFDDMKDNRKEDLDDYFGSNPGKLIDLAIKHDKFESFVEIFETYKPDDIDKVAENALSFNRIRVFKHILKSECKPDWMIVILRKMKDREIDINPNTLKCFHILLNHEKYKLDTNIPGKDNITALHFAATKSEYAVIELLKKGASLGIRDKNGKMPIQFIASSTLRKFLDSCITKGSSDAKSDIDYFMVIDYSFLAGKEMKPIQYLTEANDMQPLIEHPVIASFLFLKWFRLSGFFYWNLLLSSFNAISFIIYLMVFYVHHDHLGLTNDIWHNFLRILALISFVMFSTKEFSQFISSPSSYLKSLENYFEMGFMGLMAVTLFLPLEDQQLRRSIAAVLYMGFAVEWTLMLSELPLFSVSNYIVMLKKVAINFVRTLTFYSIILLAFAGGFYTLTNKTNRSTRNFTAGGSNETLEANNSDESEKFTMFSVIFQVILMLTGDFQEISEKVGDSTIGRLFLLAFVLSMSIVMMNLLVGLTVSDTAAIEGEAEWYKWWIRAKLLGKYECMASNW
jgi:hypothetical protein